MGILLPVGDVRAEGEARVWLLRPAVLHGDRIVGRIDPVFDRKTRVLTVNADLSGGRRAIPEAALERALKSLGRWLGAEKISGLRR